MAAEQDGLVAVLVVSAERRIPAQEAAKQLAPTVSCLLLRPTMTVSWDAAWRVAEVRIAMRRDRRGPCTLCLAA